MSEPTLADVIARLDRLEVLLAQLVEVARAGSPLRAPSQKPSPVAAVSAPPVIPVAPPPVAGPAGAPPVIQVAPPVSRASAPAPIVEPGATYDPYAERTDIEVPGPSSSIQQVLRRVFEAGLMAEPEDTWAIMTKLTHPSQMIGPRALEHFKAFNWHKLRRTASTYLQNGDPGSFVIVYTDPSEITSEVDRVRAFVKAGDNRMPVPVGFARDATQGNAWRVTMMSL